MKPKPKTPKPNPFLAKRLKKLERVAKKASKTYGVGSLG